MALGSGNSKKQQPVRSAMAGSPVPPAPVRAADVKPPAVEYKQAAPAKATGSARVSADDIRKRAYEIYLKRRATGAPGGPETDWFQDEREVSVRA